MSQAPSHDGALRYDDVRGTPIVLTPEDLAKFEKQRQALIKLLGEKKIIAKYKIEIMFGKARSTSKPTPGMMSFWANGSKFHGGGDEKLYLCPGASLKQNGCTALLQDSYNSSLGSVCPACGNVWTQPELIGEIFFNLTMQNWARVIYRYFHICEAHCDIYLKHAPDDIRTVALAQAERQTWRGSELLDKTRAKRARHIYPLKNIIKDTSAGADLLNRFHRFLVA